MVPVLGRNAFWSWGRYGGHGSERGLGTCVCVCFLLAHAQLHASGTRNSIETMTR
jgi:hypothetical protein